MLYDDVRAAVYRQKTLESRKSAYPTLSVKLWLEQIGLQGGKGKFMDAIEGDATKFMCAWSTKFQLKVMEANTGIMCMDSTHKTVKSLLPSRDNDMVYTSGFLFTILVRDRKTHSSVPIAFMICNSESIETLTSWLLWLKEDCGMNPSKFMVDCSVVESEAIARVFRRMDIYYCSFHVGQAWERKLRELHNVEDSNRMRGAMKAIRKAGTDEKRVEAMNNFEARFLPGAQALVNYLKKWMLPHKLEMWAIYMRQGHQEINTNNLVESWHKTLKSQEGAQSTCRRLDIHSARRRRRRLQDNVLQDRKRHAANQTP
ncbi:hypothetical protein EMPS_10902 [Entomortierella parvispora]|uniref:MULE transposase domain-containing protein n=1 Tax=Entomortierella parvispora TaxID=205924 RepID=A0A9P3HLH4_9FUNG|nr:hypothetical protein EMPS_10902 [Entomortierella parvispora]